MALIKFKPLWTKQMGDKFYVSYGEDFFFCFCQVSLLFSIKWVVHAIFQFFLLYWFTNSKLYILSQFLIRHIFKKKKKKKKRRWLGLSGTFPPFFKFLHFCQIFQLLWNKLDCSIFLQHHFDKLSVWYIITHQGQWGRQWVGKRNNVATKHTSNTFPHRTVTMFYGSTMKLN